MHRNQFKRERPTFKTAHDFFKDGFSSVDRKAHLLKGEERQEELRNTEAKIFQIYTQQFPRTQNLEYAILKAHLIVEYALTEYIRESAVTAVSSENIRFTFAEKIEIAYLFGFGVNDPVLLPTIERLNKVRNQVAHTFFLDRTAVDEMLRVNHWDYANFKPRDDRERIRILRLICGFICGRIAGELVGAHEATKLVTNLP